jgi:hypothetical protein
VNSFLIHKTKIVLSVHMCVWVGRWMHTLACMYTHTGELESCHDNVSRREIRTQYLTACVIMV